MGGEPAVSAQRRMRVGEHGREGERDPA